MAASFAPSPLDGLRRPRTGPPGVPNQGGVQGGFKSRREGVSRGPQGPAVKLGPPGPAAGSSRPSGPFSPSLAPVAQSFRATGWFWARTSKG